MTGSEQVCTKSCDLPPLRVETKVSKEAEFPLPLNEVELNRVFYATVARCRLFGISRAKAVLGEGNSTNGWHKI